MTVPGTADRYTLALSRLVSALAEDAIFALAAARSSPEDALEGIARRRAEAYTSVLRGGQAPRMSEDLDRWIVELTRTLAPIAPPEWLPMSSVIREKVTLEIGARGLRSLFSTKPSDKDVARVKRLGTLTVRVLRSVFAADGPVDAEEARMVQATIAALGLPDPDAAQLASEPPLPAEQLDIYGDVEPGVVKALVRGAWYAAAIDALDPREEVVVRVVAKKLGMTAEDLEESRQEVLKAIESRRVMGLATVDAIRFVLADRMPGEGVRLAATAGTLTIPRRYREEALAQVAHGAPVTLARRHAGTTADERVAILGIAWAAAMSDDPSLARRALLRARHERVAGDLGDDGVRVRAMIDNFVQEVTAPVAYEMVK